ncbi:MAG: (d)CMP kinase, partial [Rhodocyclaceae bacterium]|nr:(d)CMP kinase [Rhodocyclaceae bacterium]
ICIDGPSASGKGTLASLLAQRLGWHYLDSGALYRAAALAARRAGLLDSAVPDEAAISALVGALELRFDGARLLMGGEDVSDAIRSEQAGMDASFVAAMPQVRAALLARQRAEARLPGLVADGRDMGSVVFPAAPLKIFLSASAEQRALRRQKQLQERGIAANLDSLCADMRARDARDTNRAVAPLQAAQDAVLLDSSGLTIEQTLEQALALWHGTQPFQ